MTDPDGTSTRFEYNSRGELMALTDPNNQRTVMRYDQNGRLFLKYSSTNSTQAGSSLGATPVVMTVNNLTRYQYNDNDQLVKVISGVDGVQSKNSNLELKFVSDEDGQGRLIRKFSSSKEENFTYRIDGKLSQYSSKNTELQNKLDQLSSNGGLPISINGFSEVQLLKTDVQYHYDGLGRRILKQVSNTLVMPISERCEEKCDKKGKIYPQYLKQCTPKIKLISFYQKFNYLSDQEQILIAQNGEQKTTLVLDKYDSSNPNDHLGELSKEHKLAYAKDHLGSIMNSYANFDPELDDSKYGKGDHHQKHRNRNWDKNEKSKDSHDDDDDDDGLSLANLSNLDSNGYDLDLAEYAKSRNNHSKMQQHRLYGTYGESTPLTLAPNSPAVTYGYTGAEYDLESNTYYLRARNYDPYSARFLIKDPIGFNGGDTNLYRYVTNAPLNSTDPSGKCPLCAVGIAVGGGAVIGAVSNGFGTYLAGGNAQQIISSAGTGAIAGGAAILTSIGVVLGAAPTAAGVALGIGVDLGIQFAFLPTSLPNGMSLADAQNGVNAIKRGPSCPNQ